MILLNKKFQQHVREVINDPNFQKPLSALKTDYSQRGQIILVTKMSKLCEMKNAKTSQLGS